DVVYEWWGEEPLYMGGNTIALGNDNEVLYGSGSLLYSYNFLGNNFYNTIYGYKALPFHPKFSFSSVDNPDIIQGNNTPIQLMGLGYDESFQIITKLLYRGRYGESRESDSSAVEVLAKQDGNIIFEGNYIDFIQNPIPFTGELDITFTNTNVQIGNIT